MNVLSRTTHAIACRRLLQMRSQDARTEDRKPKIFVVGADLTILLSRAGTAGVAELLPLTGDRPFGAAAAPVVGEDEVAALGTDFVSSSSSNRTCFTAGGVFAIASFCSNNQHRLSYFPIGERQIG
jgi:hypothetical protein